jgi:hypothetical protein
VIDLAGMVQQGSGGYDADERRRGRDASPRDPVDIASLPTSPFPSPPLAIALQKAVALLESLSREQLEDIASGDGKLVYRPGRRMRREAVQRPTGVDVAAAAADINLLATPAEVSDYLWRNDARFTVPVLKQIARALGPTVATTGRTKAELRRDIVEGTAGFRTRSAAMSDGAWS